MDRRLASRPQGRGQLWSRTSIHLDKYLFVGAALFGAAAIILLDFTTESKWAAVTLCIVIMVSYAVAGFLVPAFKLRPDQTADNLYYLGLLYTLTSLGTALIRFTTSEEATDAILRNFGIAIFTTIAGLALRVFVGQFREDPEDLEYEAKLALSQSVHNMRRELDLSVAQLRSFADGMAQAVSEFADTAHKATVSSLERAASRFEASALSVGEKLEASANTFSDRARLIDAALEATNAALALLATRIEAVQADPDVLERGLRPALTAVQEAVAGFADVVARERDRFDEGAKSVARFSQAASGLEDSGRTLNTAAAELGASAAGLARVNELLGALEKASASAAQSTEQFSAKLEEIASRADTRSEQSVASIHKVASDAADAAAREAEARLQSLEAAARRVIDSLGALDREFAGSGQTIERVRAELTELAGWIIARLER